MSRAGVWPRIRSDSGTPRRTKPAKWAKSRSKTNPSSRLSDFFSTDNFPPKQTFSLGFPLETCDWLNDVSISSLFHFAANHRKRGFAKNKNHVPIFSLFLFLRTCQKRQKVSLKKSEKSSTSKWKDDGKFEKLIFSANFRFNHVKPVECWSGYWRHTLLVRWVDSGYSSGTR